MIIQKIVRLVINKDEKYRFQLFLEKVKRNEELRAKENAKRTTYINPCKLRIGCIVRPEIVFTILQPADYCPV